MIDRFFAYLLKNQVIFALFLIVAGWLVVEIRGIIAIVFISYILMASILPFVRFLRRKGLPQFAAVMVPYLTIFIIIFALIFPLVPFFTQQVQSLTKRLPSFLNATTQTFGVTINPKQVEDFFSGASGLGGAFAVTSKVFGGVIAMFSIIVISLYLLLYHDDIKKRVAHLFQKDNRPRVLQTFDEVNDKLGSWLRGQLLLCFSIGLGTFIALTILSMVYKPMPYVLPLALFAGLLEIVPTLGPIIAGFLAAIVALTVSPTMVVLIILVYFAVQELEAHILVPKIMQHAVGLNPLVVIIGVIIGTHLMGIMGALLSIPLISLFVVLFENISEAEAEDKD